MVSFTIEVRTAASIPLPETSPMAFQSCTSKPNLFDAFLASPPKNETLRQLKTLIDCGKPENRENRDRHQ